MASNETKQATDALDEVFGVGAPPVSSPLGNDLGEENFNVGDKKNTRQKVKSIKSLDGWVSPPPPYDISYLPGYRLYPANTQLEFKPLTVQQIQNFSIMNMNIPGDAREKMNEVLAGSVRLVNRTLGGQINFRNLLMIDRYHVLFLLRDVTFPNPHKIYTSYYHDDGVCNYEGKVEIGLSTFSNYEPSDELMQFYNSDPEVNCFAIYNPETDNTWYLKPPTLGVEQDFFKFVQYRRNQNRKVNIKFANILPLMFPNQSKVDYEEIERVDADLAKIDISDYTLLHQFSNDLNTSFGIKELKHRCDNCGEEISTPFRGQNERGNLWLPILFIGERNYTEFARPAHGTGV